MNKWDKKAKNYSRYNEEIDSFEQGIFKKLSSLHVDFQNKTLLDIGCGTGVYTLHLARKCISIDAIDSSVQMLQLLEKDAKKLHINNIKTQVTTWENYSLPQNQYDIALCTMSPALSRDEDFQKVSKCAKTKIYLGWAGKRDTQIIEALFEAHGCVYTPPNGAQKVKNWLEKNKYFYQMVPFEETKVKTREFTKVIENFAWHLDVRGVKPNIATIKAVIEKYRDKDGNVTEITINHMNLLVW